MQTQQTAAVPAERADGPRSPSQVARADSAPMVSAGALVGVLYPIDLLGLQRLAGNRAATTALTATVTTTPVVSRQNVPAPTSDPDFDKTTFIFDGPRFALTYTPVGEIPKVGTAAVTLRIHIDFKDFTAANALKEPFRGRLTPTMRADFKWTDAEKEKFGRDLITSIHAGWSAKHVLATNEPTLIEHRAVVGVTVELTEAGKAHNTMEALKIPKGKPGEKALPRFRSNAGLGVSHLEQRDVSEEETRTTRDKAITEQVTGFANDSADLTPEIRTQISTVATKIKKANITFGERTTPDGKKHDVKLFAVGRSTSPGTTRHNDDLGQRRADAVLAVLLAELGPSSAGTSMTAGEKNATDEEQFRRVDVLVSDMGADGLREVKQNTAAHEAGHMFGLGDEYVEEDAGPDSTKKFTGDKSSHYEDVKAELGEEAADEMVVKNSASMMSQGSEVLRGHYVPFLKAIEQATGKQWTVK